MKIITRRLYTLNGKIVPISIETISGVKYNQYGDYVEGDTYTEIIKFFGIELYRTIRFKKENKKNSIKIFNKEK